MRTRVNEIITKNHKPFNKNVDELCQTIAVTRYCLQLVQQDEECRYSLVGARLN